MGNTVVVWGNCQAEPIALLLREPLARHDLAVVVVPAVFLVDEAGLDRVREVVSTSAVLISQPVRDEYRIPGCGTRQLADLLPPGGRLITFPVTFHVGAFPYMVNAHGGDGHRVPAPQTDYHDLRAIVAAEAGMDVERALEWWPQPSREAVHAIAADSTARLQRREAPLDVTVSPLVDGPWALWTLDHPANRVLAGVADALLRQLGIDAAVDVPEREFLGARRAPVDDAVVAAHGWPAAAATDRWHIDKRDVPNAEVIGAHLQLYRERPDVVVDSRERYAERLGVLGL